jgi:hypothetical protein
MDIKELKKTLLDFAPAAIEELKSIIMNNKTSAKVKLDAITLLFDRVGLPALRASISQTLVGAPFDLGNLIEAKTQLTLEAERLDTDLLEVENKLGKASPIRSQSLCGSIVAGR